MTTLSRSESIAFGAVARRRVSSFLHGERLGTAVDAVDVTRAASLTDRITADAATRDGLAPLVGLVLRNREAAA